MTRSLLASAFSVALLGAVPASAQVTPHRPANTGHPPAATVLIFDDDPVDGDFPRPGETLVEVAGKTRHQSLITPRADFLPEMRKSAEDL